MNTEPTSINFAAIYVGLFVLQWIFNMGMAAWIYFNQGDKRNAQKTASVGRKLDEFISTQNARMAALEATVKHLPTDEEIGSLQATVAEMKGRVEGIDDLLKRVDRQLTIVHEHLLRK